METLFGTPIICPVLIGRRAQLTTLRLLVDQARSGKGQIVLLSGEAGIGKSRLVAEAKTYATAQGFLLLQGQCFPTDRSCPYAPLLDLLRAHLATSSPEQVVAEMGSLASALSPLLPDLLPLLVLLTYRSDEVQPGLSHFLAHLDRERLAQECALAPLTRSEVSAMLYAIFALRRSVFTVPPLAQVELLDAMYTLTEGNPFFIEELLKSLIEAGDIFYEQGRWKRKELRELHIPRSVQDAVQQRTYHLSEGARQVLHLAAVAGRHFDFALLQALTQQDEAQLLRLIKELIAAQLVVEESAEQFAFRHALTRQAVYAELLVRERKALHRTIAETIEHLYAPALEAHLADLAIHFSEAE